MGAAAPSDLAGGSRRRDMTLKQLEALYWAGTLGSFALAAERLCMTQSSLSKRIAELEDEVGEKLFDRSGTRARVTEIGNRLLPMAKRMLDLRDEIGSTARGGIGLRGVCRFGVTELVAITWLPRLVPTVRRTYPDIALQPHVAVTQELRESLLHGETDFAVGPGISTEARIVSRPVGNVELLWVCSPSMLEQDAILDASLFERYPVISMGAGSSVTAALDNWAATKPLKFSRIVTSNSMGAVAALSASGLGVALLPRLFATQFIKRGELRELAAGAGFALPAMPYFLHWRKDTAGLVSAAVRELALQVIDFSATPGLSV